MKKTENTSKIESVVRVENVHFSWDGRRTILSGVNLEIPKGKITAIMGPSGSGKTTLLNVISTQAKPQKGQVFIHDQSVYELPQKKIYQLRQRLGMLFQEGGLFSDLSVFENVAFPLREHKKLPEDVLNKVVLMKLEAVGLRGAKDLMPYELSGGMARRVALARTLALDPELIFYDEPFSGLDPITKGVILSLVKELTETLGITSVLVSHNVDQVIKVADYVYLIARGHVIAEGAPDVLFSSDQAEVKQFMHGLPEGPVSFHYQAPDYEKELLG